MNIPTLYECPYCEECFVLKREFFEHAREQHGFTAGEEEMMI